jgi:hypothetical protein
MRMHHSALSETGLLTYILTGLIITELSAKGCQDTSE